ncbi:MAG: MG2 domain-containing protein [Candidatus Gracilibacteria bacterium]|nr:MG2 domain-containing protein [Candidatus Gracilibacteria bacterium]
MFNSKLKILIGVLVFLVIVLLGVIVSTSLDRKAQKQAYDINYIIGSSDYQSCEKLFLENQKSLQKNKYINQASLQKFTTECRNSYDIKNIEINRENCYRIISSNDTSDLAGAYIILDAYQEIKNKCSLEFQKITFSTGIFFDVDNDFKSTIYMDFSIPFFSDSGETDSEEYIQNRVDAKKRLLEILEFSPSIDLGVDDVVLYPNRAVLYAKLEPTTSYEIKVKNAKIRGDEIINLTPENTENDELKLGEEKTYEEIDSFVFTTPENKYLGIKIKNPVSLYTDSMPPEFEIVDYDSGKQSVFVKLCRIDEELYSKIDILKGNPLSAESREFFINGIDGIKTVFCEEKEITLRDEIDNTKLIRKSFDFDNDLGKRAQNGLYYISFSNYIDREFNHRVQKPILFGIVGSHITMKLSRNGEAFFLVNDFEGNPLSGQNIRAYINDFQTKSREWDNDKGEYIETIYSPLDSTVLSKEIILGQTKADGILQVNIKDKIPDLFERTFNNDWEYDWTGIYNSLFIKASSNDYISYNSSKWNAGIAPWNFGYKVGSTWGQTGDDVILDRWGQIEPVFYTHTYTDRILYLPSEQVNFKTIVRNSSDLSIPENKSFTVSIMDSNGKEVYNKQLKINEYGSIFDSLTLSQDAPLGYYSIIIKDSENQIGYSTFSVEVFKNPTFTTDINLQALGLEAGAVKIDEVSETGDYYGEEYSGKFVLKANISSQYYNGANLGNANYTYKVYRQVYYDNAWWGDCFYGCYWQPQKEFYTSGEGQLDENGTATINVGVDFTSTYDDYKYILEVTITDIAGDTISSSNSLVVNLPDEYKRWNNNFSLSLITSKKFYKTGEDFEISGELDGGKWTKYYDNKYLLIIKKKDYITESVDDVRGYTRPVTKVDEKLEKIMFINSDDFKVQDDGTIKMSYKLSESGEYIFEYGQVNDYLGLTEKQLANVIDDFNKNKKDKLEVQVEKEVKISKYFADRGFDPCEGKQNCNYEVEYYAYSCAYSSDTDCENVTKTIKVNQKVTIDNLLNYSKKYFSLLAYGDDDASNPIVSDNKLQVFSEKVSYNLGEKARILVRLPFSKGKILLTVEKAGVVSKEYIDVNSNIFFKEFLVDDTFVPNAYVGVVAIEVDGAKVPEYKVGYAEIVVDKSDKKSFINIKSNKETYSPREEVTLDLTVTDKDGKAKASELSVMVVDDSLISLMGNVDINLLEKFFKKLPFQIQTSLTNLAMLENYYFARPGIVGGGGAGSFKGGDSAVSSRNIFKNTAYYNPSVVTDNSGKAQVKFTLPDNLTNFRIIVVSNSKDNFFGVSEEFIEVRKSIVVEPRTSIILRDNDSLTVGANVFNNTEKSMSFKVLFKSDYLEVSTNEQLVTIDANKSTFVEFDVKNVSSGCHSELVSESLYCNIPYTISALGDSIENSDKYEGTIELKQSPVLIQTTVKNGTVGEKSALDLEIAIPENIDLDKSKVEVVFSNNRLIGIEDIVKSLATYPYGCIEQTVSATLPNAIIKKFSLIFKDLDLTGVDINKNINDGIDRIVSMQTSDGGFKYWPGGSSSDLHITPYVVRSLIDMKDAGVSLPTGLLDSSISYLEREKDSAETPLEKAEIFWALAKAGRSPDISVDLKDANRHTLLAYTYGLVLSKKNSSLINENIEKLKSLIDKEEEGYYYWNRIADKAIFASLLMDYNYDKKYIDEIIVELYDRDWVSYYYSTQEKNNAFMAFAKYLDKYGSNNKNNFGFMLGNIRNKDQYFYIGQTRPNILKKEYSLRDVIMNDDKTIFLRVANTSGKDMYASLVLKHYPKDIEAVKAYSNGVQVVKQIYEVVDNKKMDECEEAKNSYYNIGKDVSNLTECKGVYKLKQDNIFTKGKTYKSEVIIKFPTSDTRRNVVLEDYLPAGFRALNNKFLTNTIRAQNNQEQSWIWDHIEYRPDVVFASSSYTWGDTLNFEYFFVPDFEGKFINPPTTAYMMYNPQIRANSEFEMIEIR